MELTGGQALAHQLEREGTTRVFGIPGTQLDWAIDGIAQLGDRLTYYNTRHEQATTYMADGFARSSGEVGVCMVVPGPGVLNTLAALSTAYSCSSPVLFLAGQIRSDVIGSGRGLLHEIPDQSGMLRTLTKWSCIAKAPGEIPALVHEAVRQLRSGRPMPVAVELPPDVLQARGEAPLYGPATAERVPPEYEDVKRAAVLLAGAERPALYAGWGVQSAGATEALRMLAEKLGAAVVMSLHGRGSLDDRHPLALTSLGGRVALFEADVILAIGTRFMDAAGTGIVLPTSTKLIVLNADESHLALSPPNCLRIHGDAMLGLAGVLGHLESHKARGWEIAELESIRASCAAQLAGVQPQLDWALALRAGIAEDGILVNELTQVGYVAQVGYPVYEPRTYLTAGYQGTLGYGFATALGAKVANPDRAVVSITGDGGFGWNLQELSTARKYSIGVTVIVFNDHAFGNVRRTQENDFEGRVLGADLTNPDFLQLAGAFGISSVRVHAPAELTAVLRDSVVSREPLLIEVPVGPMPSPWHLIHAEEPPTQAVESHRENRGR